MSDVRNRQIGLLLILVVVTLLLVLVFGSAAAKNNPGVSPPHSNAFGKTYAEWAVEWWKMMFALPADADHPIFAEGVVDCNNGQDGKVWFLAGSTFEFTTGVKNVQRTCEEPIPPGKALFFPVLNIVCNTYDGDDLPPEQNGFGSLDNCANFVTDNFVVPLSATVDGVAIKNLKAYRTISDEFTIVTVTPPLFGYTPSGGKGVTGGYYLLLPPLSRGEHDITFSGKILIPAEIPTDPPDVDYTINVSYDLTVGK